MSNSESTLVLLNPGDALPAGTVKVITKNGKQYAVINTNLIDE